MFIRFVSGEIDEASHVREGLFCAAARLKWFGVLPDYEFEALDELANWFSVHLDSPFDCLPGTDRYARAVCWFKSTAFEHLARAREIISILERNDVLIWTIKSRKAGYIYYEDRAQVFAEPFFDVRQICRR